MKKQMSEYLCAITKNHATTTAKPRQKIGRLLGWSGPASVPVGLFQTIHSPLDCQKSNCVKSTANMYTTMSLSEIEPKKFDLDQL